MNIKKNMKKLSLIFTVLLFIVGIKANAQEAKLLFQQEPRFYAIINKADWCPICEESGQRAGKVLGSYEAKGIAIVMNNLTDKTTTGISKISLKKEGIYAAVSHEQLTGVITFVDAATKKRIKTISVAETNKELKSDIDKLLSTKKNDHLINRS